MRAVAGIGLGWRPETAWLIEQRAELGFSEVIAENVDPRRVPRALDALLERGLPILPHGIGLSLGGAEPIDSARLEHLCRVAERLKAPFVSEHVAFVRASGIEAGHLLPLPRTNDALEVLVENVRRAQQVLPVPLVLENVASVFEWPKPELSEADFLRKLLDGTGAHWLFDVANLHANVENHGWELGEFLNRAPLDRVAYAHVAGGRRVGSVYRDTHAHPLAEGLLRTLDAVLAQTGPLPILLERDDDFGTRAELEAELDELARALAARHGDGGATHAA
jgi:uncharacterized protein (UPF0276 family)